MWGNYITVQVAGEFGRHSLYKMLGYFSLVGLLRLHSLLGDFYQAIKVHWLSLASYSCVIHAQNRSVHIGLFENNPY
jgi:hypothetical protein